MLAALPGANTSARLHPSRIAGGLIGAVLAFLLTWPLPLVPSTLLSSIGLAAGASLSGRRWRPIYWWGVLGAVTGGLLGTATVLAARLQELDPRADWPTRAFSSRLSSSLTILVASVTGPSWLVHLLFHQTHLLRAQTMPSSKDA